MASECVARTLSASGGNSGIVNEMYRIRTVDFIKAPLLNSEQSKTPVHCYSYCGVVYAFRLKEEMLSVAMFRLIEASTGDITNKLPRVLSHLYNTSSNAITL